jgi:hypothetical protein
MEGPSSKLAVAIGKDFKGKISPLLYVAGMLLAFVHPLISDAIYAFVALIWLVPDSRIETHLTRGHETPGDTAPSP